ncbi:MAG: PASTA domain-containing protein [Pseudonocardia sp.]|uniref:PASTA domain-containing protein n=1 Tax=unclassified Pseudonocardia TaxID=2619320 RepID=UPI00086C5D62|nr:MULTISPECIES: PASTA domain-containing protein [unclassified Pseudonocardia]MBN9107407.1 PASTA domain-containing protein [Pseudonocardia sp.]ODU26631.1 MAG: hypothetical protein ABS80_06380 [Pseudonocardia sp. SCN 72-51]ODV08279.1 MAG: hypothetical protein ABT15_03100 [Pseudonocardia sp. SCN 73-27]
MGTTLVPALVGLDSGEAIALGMEAGVVVVAEREGALADGGRVVAQVPAAGTQVEAASLVRVAMSGEGPGGGGPPVPEAVPPSGPAGTNPLG